MGTVDRTVLFVYYVPKGRHLPGICRRHYVSPSEVIPIIQQFQGLFQYPSTFGRMT